MHVLFYFKIVLFLFFVRILIFVHMLWEIKKLKGKRRINSGKKYRNVQFFPERHHRTMLLEYNICIYNILLWKGEMLHLFKGNTFW